MAKTFGEKIKERRIELRLTLAAVAKLIGSTKNYVWELENKRKEKSRPSADVVLNLARALNISPDFLIDDEREQMDEGDISDPFIQKYLMLDRRDKEILKTLAEALLSANQDTQDLPAESLFGNDSSIGEIDDIGADLSVFVQLKRRALGHTIEELSNLIEVSPNEIRRIEEDILYEPRPRTIFQLAQLFETPPSSLMKLKHPSDDEPTELSRVKKPGRYAAKSGAISELSREERRLLAQYIEYLDTIAQDTN